MRLRFKLVVINLLFFVAGIEGSVKFIPRVDMSVDLGYYFFHKNKEFKRLFLFESEWDAYITLFSAGDHFTFHFDPKITAGQSQSPYGYIFHPEAISYGLIMQGEYKTKFFNCLLGIDHSCFHGVDFKRHEPWYWNKLLIGAHSENIRVTDFVNGILDGTDITLQNRIAWSFIWAWHIKDFGGLVEKSAVSTSDINNLHDFEFRVKAAVFHFKNFVFSVNGLTLLGVDVNGDFCGRQVTGLDADFKCRNFVSSAYVVYYLDKNWFDSRDKLLELGVKFEK
ncbi:MAG TPA: hypothetical protein VHO70_16175 [Chitinispirillaceae bacterium]|nr:hypothetical protein [Chitinispirillaceae bacterium]